MDTNHPKDIIVFQHDELAYHPESYPSYHPEYFENIDICSLEYELPILNNQISFYPTDSSPIEGETYARSPYDSTVYVRISSLKDYVIQQKCTCFFNIARKLGAKKMDGTFIVEQAKERTWDASGKTHCKFVSCDVSVKQQEQEKLRNKFCLKSTQVGKKISLEDWNNAYQQARKYNLLAEPTVQNLLNALNPKENGGNYDLTQNITFSMSAETNKKLDMAFNLTSAMGLFKLNGEFHEATKYQYETSVNIYLEFPE